MGLTVSQTVKRLETIERSLKCDRYDVTSWAFYIEVGAAITILVGVSLAGHKWSHYAAKRYRWGQGWAGLGSATAFLAGMFCGSATLITFTPYVLDQIADRKAHGLQKAAGDLARDLPSQHAGNHVNHTQMAKLVRTLRPKELVELLKLLDFDQVVAFRSMLSDEVLAKRPQEEKELMGKMLQLSSYSTSDWQEFLQNDDLIHRLRNHPGFLREVLNKLPQERQRELTLRIFDLKIDGHQDTITINGVSVNRELIFKTIPPLKNMVEGVQPGNDGTYNFEVADGLSSDDFGKLLGHLSAPSIPGEKSLFKFYELIQCYLIDALLPLAIKTVERKAKEEGLEAIEPLLQYDDVRRCVASIPSIRNVSHSQMKTWYPLAKKHHLEALSAHYENRITSEMGERNRPVKETISLIDYATEIEMDSAVQYGAQRLQNLQLRLENFISIWHCAVKREFADLQTRVLNWVDEHNESVRRNHSILPPSLERALREE